MKDFLIRVGLAFLMVFVGGGIGVLLIWHGSSFGLELGVFIVAISAFGCFKVWGLK